jgi:digeranylgeranylglycerophospholipid reductase
MFDLAVVGAGPVGSYLSWKFSEKGYKVLLLEEHKEIGKPLACSGIISKRLWNFIPFKKELVENVIRGARIHLEGKEYLLKGKINAYMINRIKLDNFLASEAESSGVELKKGYLFQDFMETPDHITIYSKKIFKTKLLAGCDGPLSTVRKSAGLEKPKEFLQGIFTYVNKEDWSNFVDIYFSKVIAPKFFAWRVPRGKEIEYGLATDIRYNTKKYFLKFLKKFSVKSNKIYSGLIPINPPNVIHKGRVFLCGDAAAQVKPYTGGGVLYGLTCAKIASQIIDPNHPRTINLYERMWRKKLSKEIKVGMWIKRAYSFSSFSQKILLRFIEKKSQFIDMDKPSTIFEAFK